MRRIGFEDKAIKLRVIMILKKQKMKVGKMRIKLRLDNIVKKKRRIRKRKMLVLYPHISYFVREKRSSGFSG